MIDTAFAVFQSWFMSEHRPSIEFVSETISLLCFGGIKQGQILSFCLEQYFSQWQGQGVFVDLRQFLRRHGILMPLSGDRQNKCQVAFFFRMAHKQGLIPLYYLKITLRKEVVR